MKIREAYEVLGIEPGTDYVAAHRAYRARARAHHPDTVAADRRGEAAHEMARINQAWKLLREELKAPAIEATHEPGDDGGLRPEDFREQEPTTTPWFRRRTPLAAAAALLVVAGVGVALGVGGSSDPSPQDYIGSCLNAAGDVRTCGDDDAAFEVVETSDDPGVCEGDVFSDADGGTFFCTRAAGA